VKHPPGGPPRGTTLAFDYGTRRIGVAVGDCIHATASALLTLKARDGVPPWNELDALVAEWQPVTLVVGIARHADGNESTMGTLARTFAATLEERYGLPVELVDESLTSRAADAELRELRKSGLLPRRVRPDDSDRIAARLILEAWMARGDNAP